MRLSPQFVLMTGSLGLAACELSTRNSSSNDALTFAPRPDKNTTNDPAEASAARFRAVQMVLGQNSCLRCHASFGRMDEAAFLNAVADSGRPLVKAGDAMGSELYIRLRGATPEGDMPPEAGLKTEDVKAVAEWIQLLATVPAPEPTLPPAPDPTPTTEPTPDPSPAPTPDPDPTPGPTPEPSPEPSPTPPPVSPELARFLAAKAPLDAKCASCHAHAQWKNLDEAGFKAEETFDGPLVVPGAPLSSPIYTRLKAIFPDGDMPRGNRPVFTPEEAAALREWIEKLSP
jgi:uncharacterized membrane protein